MATKKLTKLERLVDDQMLALLEWASEHADCWHDIGELDALKKAAELPEKRGVIETRQPMNQFRLKPKTR
jgi:hypothetical protein